nr:ATP-binding protein [Variovorax sp. S12S4]
MQRSRSISRCSSGRCPTCWATPRYAVKGSAITVRIGVNAEGGAEISVENTGPDIDALHIPRLFDRFFRTDESRTDGHLHHGLGLAIVAAIARMHSGYTMAISGSGRTRIGFAVSRSLPP